MRKAAQLPEELMMPVTDGIVLIRGLRAAAPMLPIIASTVLDLSEKRIELASFGVTDVLLKPCSGDELLELVGHLLARPT